MTSQQTGPGKAMGATPIPGVASSGNRTSESIAASPKKRNLTESIGNPEDDTPTKKLRVKNSGYTKVPTCEEELSEADQLMLKLKKEGKTWTQVTAAVSALTGQAYGKSTLSNRHNKIVNSLAKWKDGDIERMLFVRKKVVDDTETAIAAFKRDAENKIWSNMAAAMAEIGADEYSGGAVEKMYKTEKRLGFPHETTIETVMASSTPNPRGNHKDETDDDDDDDNTAADSGGEEDDEIALSGEDDRKGGSEEDDFSVA